MNMTLLEFINRISPEEYFVSGTYHEAARHSLALPAEGVGRFLQDGESLLFEGSYRHDRGATSHQFSVKVPLDLPEAGGVEISSVHTGRLVGHVLPAGNGLEVLAWRDGASIFSCHVEANADGALLVNGSARCAGVCIAFSLRGVADADRSTLGNVVSIMGGRRA